MEKIAFADGEKIGVIGEDGVGLGDLLEALLGIGRLVHVGMELARLLLEGLANLVGRGLLGDPEDLVVVLVGHEGHGRCPSKPDPMPREARGTSITQVY